MWLETLGEMLKNNICFTNVIVNILGKKTSIDVRTIGLMA